MRKRGRRHKRKMMQMLKIRGMKVKKKKDKDRGRDRTPILSSASAKPILVRCVTGEQLPRDLVFEVKKGERTKEIVHSVNSVTGGIKLPDDMVFEVLARVERIKTLHQYKCVAKCWRSMIQSSSFLEAYRSHHRGGLLLCLAKKDRSSNLTPPPVRVNFHYSTLLDQKPEPFFSRSMVSASHLFMGITNVVNGLACVYEVHRVILCNVCTGETLRLPDPKWRDTSTRSLCYLGYDTTGRVYKLIKLNATNTVCSAAELEMQPADCEHLAYRRLECEILTLGQDSTWRKVSTAGAPIVRMGGGVFLIDEPLLINGVMYWIMDFIEEPARVLSFDLNKEEFLHLKPPQDPIIVSGGHDWGFALAQLGDRPALFYCGKALGKENGYFAFHLLQDDQGNSWKNHVIDMPPEFRTMGCPRMVAVGNLPSGQTLFGDVWGRLRREPNEGYKTIFSYDHQKNKFERLCVGPLSHLIYDPVNPVFRTVVVTCLEENFAPIDVQLSSG